jgi:voltage-gated potassium channel
VETGTGLHAMTIKLPARRLGPLRAIGVRVAVAVALILFIVIVVYVDRDGYRDVNGDGLTLIDSFYYTVVSLSTTGYGDITPMTQSARLVNVLLVTPARVLFLIILVGTTLELLTDQYRSTVRLSRWRRTLKNHVIVCGYGTKGRSAVRALVEDGIDKKQIVVIEPSPAAARQANDDGLVVVEGTGTRSADLTQAQIRDAQAVIIATHADETAVLITLTARQMTAGSVRIIAAVREDENAPLLRQSGAHHVVVSSANAGRLLGLSTTSPPLIDLVEDLLTPRTGMALATRSARRDEVGRSPRDLDDVVIAVYRRGRLESVVGEGAKTIETGDTLIYIRDAQSAELATE